MKMDSGGSGGSACLLCRDSALEPILDLGETVLANAFLREDQLAAEEARYPLRLSFCPNCGHVQLLDRVDPPEMFRHYLYISSASETLRTHFDQLSELLIARRGLGSNDLVVDIGCNDASLLKSFKLRGVRTLGVDPAENLATYSSEEVERLVDFFNSDTADRMLQGWGPASLVTITNTFPHIHDLDDFVRGLDKILGPGGAVVIEAHYLRDMLAQTAFDTIYHEHVSYWRLGSIARLFEQYGMEVVRAELLPLHHGQIRVTIQRTGEGKVDSSVSEILESETAAGLDTIGSYREFASRVLALRSQVRERLTSLQDRGLRLAGYGAPAKGTIFLNFVGVGVDLIPYICDCSPLKQGLYMPGTRIPIVSPERLVEDKPDYVLLLAWNFAAEIVHQQSAYMQGGGRFLVPLPELHELGAMDLAAAPRS